MKDTSGIKFVFKGDLRTGDFIPGIILRNRDSLKTLPSAVASEQYIHTVPPARRWRVSTMMHGINIVVVGERSTWRCRVVDSRGV